MRCGSWQVGPGAGLGSQALAAARVPARLPGPLVASSTTLPADMRFNYRDKQPPYSYASSLSQAMQVSTWLGRLEAVRWGILIQDGQKRFAARVLQQTEIWCPHLPVLQVYSDADLLLGAYSVPLEYDPDLIRQVPPGTAAVAACFLHAVGWQLVAFCPARTVAAGLRC